MLLLIIVRENRRRDRAYGAPPDVAGENENGGRLPMLTDETDGENHVFRYVY